MNVLRLRGAYDQERFIQALLLTHICPTCRGVSYFFLNIYPAFHGIQGCLSEVSHPSTEQNQIYLDSALNIQLNLPRAAQSGKVQKHCMIQMCWSWPFKALWWQKASFSRFLYLLRSHLLNQNPRHLQQGVQPGLLPYRLCSCVYVFGAIVTGIYRMLPRISVISRYIFPSSPPSQYSFGTVSKCLIWPRM